MKAVITHQILTDSAVIVIIIYAPTGCLIEQEWTWPGGEHIKTSCFSETFDYDNIKGVDPTFLYNCDGKLSSYTLSIMARIITTKEEPTIH
jgi:hypothetical protein